MTDAYSSAPDLLTDEELDALVSRDTSDGHEGLVDHPMAVFVREACDVSATASVEPGPELLNLFQVRSSDPLPPGLLARRAPSPPSVTDGPAGELRPATAYRPSLVARVFSAFQLTSPRPLAALTGVTAVLVLITGAVAGGLALRDDRVVETSEVAIAAQESRIVNPGATTVPQDEREPQEASTEVPAVSEKSEQAEVSDAVEPSSLDVGEPDDGSATAPPPAPVTEVDESSPATTAVVTSTPVVSQTTAQQPQTTTTLDAEESESPRGTATIEAVEETTTTTTIVTSTTTVSTIIAGDPESVVLKPGVAYQVPKDLGPGTYLADTSGDACRITVQRSGGGSVVITPTGSVISFIVTQGDTVTISAGCPSIFGTVAGPISN